MCAGESGKLLPCILWPFFLALQIVEPTLDMDPWVAARMVEIPFTITSTALGQPRTTGVIRSKPLQVRRGYAWY